MTVYKLMFLQHFSEVLCFCVCCRVRLGSDRLGRIAGHILSQQCFYPLYPPAEEINLDLELWAKYASLEVMPHILILPSDLRCFIKVNSPVQAPMKCSTLLSSIFCHHLHLLPCDKYLFSWAHAVT